MPQSQGGNDNDSFILSDPMEGILVMNKALDYDHGKREFKIQIQASVSLSSSPNRLVSGGKAAIWLRGERMHFGRPIDQRSARHRK